MLNENKFYPASDLWALGCVIYQMIVGVTPFHGSVDYEVFAKISERKIRFPRENPPEVNDLVDKLLQLNPTDRLGAGAPGSSNDYRALKAHPFFKGIDFNTLATSTPPIPPEYNAYFKQLEKKIEVEDEVFRIMGKAKDTVGENNSKSSATEDSIKSEKR